LKQKDVLGLIHATLEVGRKGWKVVGPVEYSVVRAPVEEREGSEKQDV
jgi:hypothetical protein